MKFMLLLGGDEADTAQQPQEDLARSLQTHMELERDLTERGLFVDGDPLQPRATAVTVRRRGDEFLVSDGPFLETKEHLGGFYLFEAESLDQAVGFARTLRPAGRAQYAEVRPARTGAQWRGPVNGKQRFMLLLVSDSRRRPTRDELFRNIDQHYEVSLRLATEGRFWGSRSLGPPSEAKTLRPGDDGPVTSDGPYAETREFIGGYFIVVGDSIEEAVEVAKELCDDAVEVRPIWDLHDRTSRARSSDAS